MSLPTRIRDTLTPKKRLISIGIAALPVSSYNVVGGCLTAHEQGLWLWYDRFLFGYIPARFGHEQDNVAQGVGTDPAHSTDAHLLSV